MFHVAQLNRLIGQHTNTPVVASTWRRAFGEGEQLSRLFVAEQAFAAATALLLFVSEHRLDTSAVKSLADIAHRLLCDSQSFGYVCIVPSFITFEQCLCSFQIASVGFALSQKVPHAAPFVLSKVYLCTLSHKILSFSPSILIFNQTSFSYIA